MSFHTAPHTRSKYSMKPSIWKYLLVLLFPAFIAGCANVSDFFQSNAGHLTTQTAIVQYVASSKDPKATAARLTKWTGDIRKAMGTIPNLSLSDVDQDLRNEIITGDLAPAAKPLANQLLTAIEQDIEAKLSIQDIAKQILPLTDAQKAVVNGILDDIDLAVKMALG